MRCEGVERGRDLNGNLGYNLNRGEVLRPGQTIEEYIAEIEAEQARRAQQEVVQVVETEENVA